MWLFEGDYPLPLAHVVETVGRQVRQCLDLAAGPEHFHFVGFFVTAEAKVKAKIILGEVASTASHLIQLDSATRG